MSRPAWLEYHHCRARLLRYPSISTASSIFRIVPAVSTHTRRWLLLPRLRSPPPAAAAAAAAAALAASSTPVAVPAVEPLPALLLRDRLAVAPAAARRCALSSMALTVARYGTQGSGGCSRSPYVVILAAAAARKKVCAHVLACVLCYAYMCMACTVED